MRKISFLLLILLAAAGASAQQIWSGEKTFGTSWSDYEQLGSDKFASVQVADMMVFSVKDVVVSAECQWPQIMLNNGSWSPLACAGNANLTVESTTVKYGVTQAMLSELRSSGMVIAGVGYTLTGIDLEKGNGGAGYENAVWIGQSLIDWNNGKYAAIPSSSFRDAKAGDLLRMKVADVQSGAMGHISTGSWTDLPDATDYPAVSGKYFEYTITEAMLAELQKNGMIVTGVGYTLTSIEAFDPASLPNLTTSLTIDDSDWVWENGATPEIKVNVTNNGTEGNSSTIEVVVETDKRQPVKTFTTIANTAAGTSTTNSVLLDGVTEPGFYVVTVTVNDELVRSFNIGVSPTEIVSAPDKQADFDDFWTTALEELKAIDMDVKLTKLDDKSTSKRNVYLVEMKSVGNGDGEPVTIRGYYAEPVAEGKYPCCIHFMGYDNRDSEYLWCMGGNDHDGWCDLIFSHRGQYLNNKLHSPEDDIYGDYFAYNFGNKDAYYYRGAYLDCVRAIEFVLSRQAVDEYNVFAQGSSQGGALTIAAAALSGKLRAIAPSIQFLGDFPDYFEVGQWPASVARAQQKELGLSDADMYAFLSYFDTKNLATRITCPVISSIGLQDNVCPPHTNMAPYNNLASEVKQIIYQPELMHAVGEDWWNVFFNFFEAHKADMTGVAEVVACNDCNSRSYNLAGQEVGKSFKGVVIRNGKKTLVY